jgi:hypothetical protein
VTGLRVSRCAVVSYHDRPLADGCIDRPGRDAAAHIERRTNEAGAAVTRRRRIAVFERTDRQRSSENECVERGCGRRPEASFH